MAEIQFNVLCEKLNPLAFETLNSAYHFCKMRGNPKVRLAHWVHQILQLQESDWQRALAHFRVDRGRVEKDLAAAFAQLERGAPGKPAFHYQVDEAVKNGWLYASLLFRESHIRLGHVLVGILKSEDLTDGLLSLSPQFEKINLEELTDHFAKIVAGSPEEALRPEPPADAAVTSRGDSPRAPDAAGLAKQEALGRFSVDLTERARKGEIDPVLGRDEEIRQIVDILMRRRQNNPILTGEAGVGKTAVVEGFARRIAAGDVPPALRDVTLRTLDLGLLQAGASMRGEFENRLRQVIDEVQASPKPIILFIDEAHTLIGAGGQAGQGDAANLLKPALARGTLRTIAATTWGEYKQYFENDAALTRRFQVVKVEEPSEEKTVLMIRGLAPVLEKHHQVELLEEALRAAARLSHRYIPARQLPDKAVSLIDTACARVAVSQHSTPPAIEDCRRRIESLQAELTALAREMKLGAPHAKRHAALAADLAQEQKRLAALEDAWKREQQLVGRITALKQQIGNGSASPAPAIDPAVSSKPAGKSRKKTKEAPAATIAADSLAELAQLQKELAALQGENPLILPVVDEQAVASVVADWTGVPVGRMMKDEIQSVLQLADTLEKRVIGQRHALETIAKGIQISRAGLDNPGKPVGVFLLAGASGVGKTETALALAEALYGGEDNVITINMSEFQGEETISTLKGAAPGLVGYGKGGVLTEAVRRRPHSIVLLDEFEKADSSIHELFYQVFDKGRMDDAEGRRIDFKNTVLLLTTNAGGDLIADLCKDPATRPEPEGLAESLRPDLLKAFPAALLGRLTLVPYYPLNDDLLKAIIRLQLDRLTRRLAASREIAMTCADAVVDLISSRCTESETGARLVDAILTQTLLPAISRELLTRTVAGQPTATIRVGVENSTFTYQFA